MSTSVPTCSRRRLKAILLTNPMIAIGNGKLWGRLQKLIQEIKIAKML